MLILDILLAFWWLWLPLIILALVYLHDRNRPRPPQTFDTSTSQPTISQPLMPPRNESQDLEWNNYIASFLPVVRTKAERSLLDAMLLRKTPDQLYTKTTAQAPPLTQTPPYQQPATNQQLTAMQPIYPQPSMATSVPTPTIVAKPREPLDNTVLLLYFGAFLLIASAGLFVAIGDLSGLVRSLTLAVTSGLLYIAGHWLYTSKPKLKQAGLSFIGVGMMMAPLVGVAWYNLVADQQNGALIWALTSIICLGLYIHAYSVVENQFIAYLLIGSFVSTIESSVLIISLPSYVYAWLAIGAGLSLQLLGITKGQSKPFLIASDTSSQLLVPLSVITSLVMLPNFGSMQLATTLLLSGGYYALLAWQRPSSRDVYSTTAQLALAAAVANIAYAVSHSYLTVASTFAAVTVLYVILVAVSKRQVTDSFGFITVGSLTSIASILFALNRAWPLAGFLGIATIFALVVWLKRQSNEALVIAGALGTILPLVIGQYAIEQSVSEVTQLILYVPTLLGLLSITLASSKKASWLGSYDTAAILYIVAAVFGIFIGWAAGTAAILALCSGLAASFIVLQYVTKRTSWWILASFITLVPLVYALSEYGADDRLFSLTVALGLVVNVTLSLITRESTVRWVLVGCILLAPIALGAGGAGFQWEEAGYAGGYLLAMTSCILARAIARGKLLVSSKVALASYEKAASQAFVFGYITAALLAIIISLADTNSQIVTTAVLGFLFAAVLYVSSYVESYSEGLVILPLLLQGTLFSGIRPDLSDNLEFGVIALASASLAVVMYWVIESMQQLEKRTHDAMLLTTVITAYIGPVLIFFEPSKSELLPVSLAIAGLLTFWHNRNAAQEAKEISLFVVIIALHWLLILLHLTNIVIHAQILAVFLGGFAYWRHAINDKPGEDGYISALFAVATLPLIVQALGGENGATYGLLLIVQQVGFMVLGSIVNSKILVQGGLWVAAGAVLYQLRGLGWAFLAIIAVIIIGVAIYRLQKHGDGPNDQSGPPNSPI